MNKTQFHSLQILIDFDYFCKQYGLEYSLAWGTLLGAIRHRGFIPWDDDIDIAMDTLNWNRFKVLVSQGKLPPHLRFEDSFYTSNCKVPKIRDLRFSNIKDSNGGAGYFIDIFPFRHYSTAEMILLRFCCLGSRCRSLRKTIKNQLLKIIFSIVVALPCMASSGLKKLIFPILENRKETSPGEYIGKYVFLNPVKVFRVADFHPYSRIPFEGHNLPVPHNWDAILRETYGDYMTPIDTQNRHYQ